MKRMREANGSIFKHVSIASCKALLTKARRCLDSNSGQPNGKLQKNTVMYMSHLDDASRS